jgi:hypothetical protein
MSVKVIDGDSSITVQQGSISIDAANAISILAEGGPITIEQGGGKIELSDGNLSIQGNAVSINGSSVAVMGQSVQMMGGGGAAAVASKAAAPAVAVAAVAAVAATTSFDDKIKLLSDDTGQPLAQTDYAIKRASGAIEHGTTDDVGHTHLLSSVAASEHIQLFISEK